MQRVGAEEAQTPSPHRAIQILNDLAQPITALPGVGPKMREQLARLNLKTLRDLLFHVPHDIHIYTQTGALEQCSDGQRITCLVRIEKPNPFRRGLNLTCCLLDPLKQSAPATGETIRLLFLKGPLPYFKKRFAPGTHWYCSGRLSLNTDGATLVHPQMTPGNQPPPESAEVIYPLTEGLQNNKLRQLIWTALEKIPPALDWHDPHFLKVKGWPSLYTALHSVHKAMAHDTLSNAHPARRRLFFDQLLAKQLLMLRQKHARQTLKAPPCNGTGTLQRHLCQKAGFTLTPSQTQALQEVQDNLKRNFPMKRLLQGDVGSGKSMVAYLACAQTIESDHQAAFLVPTEVLAQQHYKKLETLFEGTSVRVTLLTRHTSSDKETMQAIAQGSAQLVVGTHALFQSQVAFAKLALVIVDEQQRFGVEQRLSLLEKAETNPHLLTMSATPIPRSYELSQYGDMDHSKLTDLPFQKPPTRTYVMPASKTEEVMRFVEKVCTEDGRVFWLCPLIEEGEEDSPKTAVETRYKALREQLPASVDFLHSGLTPEEKATKIEAFRVGQKPVLVSTTVIETGIDIPDATLMVIEDANYFGLSQLHQLRGRVGRRHKQGTCIALYKSPLSENGRKRLEIFRETTDGFHITEEDWRIRGGGDLLGTKQSGFDEQLLENQDLLEEAQETAVRILKEDPSLSDIWWPMRLLVHFTLPEQRALLLKSG